ncbi:DsbA family protein [archaeon]|nr:DsbA family protein [archaeon]
MEEGNIKIKKSTMWQVLTGVFAVLFVISLFTGGFGIQSSTTGEVVKDTQDQPSKNNKPSGLVDAKQFTDDDAVLGDPDAPVTIIEWSDYECPFCSRFWSQTLPQIKEQYIDTGKVKLVYRDFPLSFHQNAQKAAEATECVREQGGDEAFWKMHDKIFENQQSLSEANLKIWANELGYDISECLDSGKYTSETQKDLSDGSTAGIRGTPGFLVNGQLVSGAQPFSAFEQVIESQL